MKTKLVLWGNDDQQNRILLAMELQTEENKVHVHTFPEEVSTDAFSDQLMKEWRDGEGLEFPSGYQTHEMELSVSDSIVPEGISVDREDVVQRAQTEWHFIVLSSKLHHTYQSELQELRSKIDALENFDSKIWNELKSFWDKVQVQVRDRNLFREHANVLRDATNDAFAKLKELRAKLDEQFHRLSQENHDQFMAILDDIEKRVADGSRLQKVFEELKEIQRKFKGAKFTREHRSQVWERLDSTFKKVKEKRFGPGASQDRSPLERLKRRYEGLLSAIEKMQRSIKRDEDDLKFQNRKIETTDGQLEAQIRQAKIKMIEERIRSKEEKLGEMHVTKEELEKRMVVLEEKEEKRKEKEKLEEARRLAEEKIAEQIKEKASQLEENKDKLERAADALKKKPESAPSEPAPEHADGAQPVSKGHTAVNAMGELIGDAFEDAVDTVKAVAVVIGDHMEAFFHRSGKEGNGNDKSGD